MKHFIEKIKEEIVLDGYKKVIVLKDKTIDVTLERIYNCKEINTQITCPEMKADNIMHQDCTFYVR